MMAGNVTQMTLSHANARSSKLKQIVGQLGEKVPGSIGTMEALEAEIAAQSQVSFDTNQFKVKSQSESEQQKSQTKKPVDSYDEFYQSDDNLLNQEEDEHL